MADMITFELVSPEKILLSTKAEMVVVPGSEGDFAVLAGHAPVMSALRPGALEVYEGDKIAERIYVSGGFAEVSLDRLTVLAEEATPVAKLDRAQLEQKLKNAREDIEDAKSDEARAKASERADHIQSMLDSL